MASTFYYTAMKASGSKAFGFRTAGSREELAKALKDSGRVVSFKAKAASAVEAAKVTFCGKTENEDFSEDFCLV